MTTMPASDRRIRRWALTLVVLCLVTLAGTVVLRPGAPPTPTATGYTVGEPLDLPREWYEGGPTVLFFVRHDCLACQNAAGVLRRLRAALQENGIAVKLMTPRAAPDRQARFAEELGFTQENGFVAADLRGARLTTVPSVVVAGADGTVLLEALVPFLAQEGDDLFEEILSSLSGA